MLLVHCPWLSHWIWGLSGKLRQSPPQEKPISLAIPAARSGQWSKEAREYAVSTGLFAGSGTTPDGQPNYMWEDLLTREQVAQLFYRFAQQNRLI
mgnify:CR=1 FL=1